MDLRFLPLRFRKTNIAVVVTCLLFMLFVTTNHNRSGSDYRPIQSNNFHSVADLVKRQFIISDVKIKKCLKYSSCQLSKVEMQLGWKRLNTPMETYPSSLKRSIELFNHYIFVHSVPLATADQALEDIFITNQDEAPLFDTTGWDKQVFDDLVLWKKMSSRSSDTFKSTPIIRDINLLFGFGNLNDGRKHWDHKKEPIPIQSSVPPHLSLLKVSVEDEELVLNEHQGFSSLRDQQKLKTSNNYFKIMQISDLHILSNVNSEDDRTIKLLESAIDKEQDRAVDLVVITGDLIDSHKSRDFRSTILKGLSPILARNIPFVFTFGELDEVPLAPLDRTISDEQKSTDEEIEDSLKVDHELKLQILNFIATLPNCYNQLINKQEYEQRLQKDHGLANYNLKLFRELDGREVDPSKPDVLVSVLDSENHAISSTQINSLYRVNLEISSEKPFKLLFFHYPLPNYRPSGEFRIIGTYNTKLPLKKKTDLKFRDDITKLGYHVVSVGHEHDNDACILSEKFNERKELEYSIWLCYNSVTGYNGHTVKEDYERKVRFFEVDFDKQQMLSWKRTENKPMEYQMIHLYQ